MIIQKSTDTEERATQRIVQMRTLADGIARIEASASRRGFSAMHSLRISKVPDEWFFEACSAMKLDPVTNKQVKCKAGLVCISWFFCVCSLLFLD